MISLSDNNLPLETVVSWLETHADVLHAHQVKEQFDAITVRLQGYQHRMDNLMKSIQFDKVFPQLNSDNLPQHSNETDTNKVLVNCPPKFDGNIYRYPAIQFISDFESYIMNQKTHLAVREVFISCLERDAELWAGVFGTKYVCYDTLVVT